MDNRETKRLLITVPITMVHELEQAKKMTGWAKSQLITICVNRSLNSLVDEFSIGKKENKKQEVK